MKKMRFGFVILHYCAFEDTIKCVQSIEHHAGIENCDIIIVDNASPNGTGNKLQKQYQGKKHCHVIINKENLGFAKGNNVGFRYAKYTLHCDFICVMNSDVYLIDDNFTYCAIKAFEKYRYDVLGPDVHTPNGVPGNPIGNHIITLRETKKKIQSLKCQIILNSFNLDEFGRKISRKLKSTNLQKKEYNRNQYYENVKLHGCCWVFSTKFIEKYDGLHEGTFLYLEEELLYLMMMKEGRKTLYCPETKIFHSEDKSTDYIQKGRKKRRFILHYHLQSMKVIRKYLALVEE